MGIGTSADGSAAGTVERTTADRRTRKLASTNSALVIRMTANASPGTKASPLPRCLRYFDGQHHRDQSSGQHPEDQLLVMFRNSPPRPSAGTDSEPACQKQGSQCSRHQQRMLAKNSQLRDRADHHKKESAHQKCEFGVERQQRLLRFRHLLTGSANPRPGSTPGKFDSVKPKPNTAINPFAPSASIPA